MTRPRPWALAFLGLALTAPGAAGQSRFLPEQLPTESQLERLELTRQWHAIVPAGDVDEEVLRISRVEGHVTIQGPSGPRPFDPKEKEDDSTLVVLTASGLQRVPLTDDPGARPEGTRVTRADLERWHRPNGMVLAQTNKGLLHAYDAESGSRLWSQRIEAFSGDSHPVAANSTTVFVAATNRLLGLDKRSGALTFKTVLDDIASSEPVADDEFVMIGQANRKIAAYSIKTQRSTWNVAAAAEVVSKPILTSRVVAFAGRDGRLFVIANQEGKNAVLYRFKADGPIDAALGTLGNRTILMASLDASIYALDLYTGELRWSFATNGPISHDFLDSGDQIYLLNDQGTLTALNLKKFWAVQEPGGGIAKWFPADQEEQAKALSLELDEDSFRNFTVRALPAWSSPGLRGDVLALSPKRIYMRERHGSVWVVDRGTGAVLSHPVATLKTGLDLRPFGLSFANAINDRVYLASKEGLIVCLREMALVKPALLRPTSERPFGFLPGIDDEGEKAGGEAAAPPAPEPGPEAEGTPPVPPPAPAPGDLPPGN